MNSALIKIFALKIKGMHFEYFTLVLFYFCFYKNKRDKSLKRLAIPKNVLQETGKTVIVLDSYISRILQEFYKECATEPILWRHITKPIILWARQEFLTARVGQHCQNKKRRTNVEGYWKHLLSQFLFLSILEVIVLC